MLKIFYYKGEPGLDGVPGRAGLFRKFNLLNGNKMLKYMYHLGLDGIPGVDGRDGHDGQNGKDGNPFIEIFLLQTFKTF